MSGGRGCAVTVSVADFVEAVLALVTVIVAAKPRPLYRRYCALVATVNVAVDAPAGTVILGTDAARAVFELEMVRTLPPAGAGSLSITVAVEVPPLPPATVEGFSVTDVIIATALTV